MGPLSYTQSVADWNIAIWHMTVSMCKNKNKLILKFLDWKERIRGCLICENNNAFKYVKQHYNFFFYSLKERKL